MEESKTAPKKITTTYTFKDHIERVWKVLVNYANTAMDGICSAPEYLKGSNCYEKGNIFKILWYNTTKCKLEVDEVIETDTYKTIKYRVHAEDFNLKYDYSYTLHLNTIEYTTLFIWDMVFDDPEKLHMDSKSLTAYTEVRKICISFWQKKLENDLVDLEHVESIMIKTSKEKAWHILLNFNKLIQIAPDVADEIIFNDESIKEGANINLIWKNKLNIKMAYKKLINNEELDEWIIKLKLLSSEPKSPKQNLIFEIIKLEDNLCFVSMKHQFREYVTYDMIESLGPTKILILSDIKKYLESNNN